VAICYIVLQQDSFSLTKFVKINDKSVCTVPLLVSSNKLGIAK